MTLLATTAFYIYAALRRVPAAIEALTAALAALAVIGPETLTTGELTPVRPTPILMAAVLQLAVGTWRRESWRCLVGSVGMTAVVAILFGGPIAFHVGLLAVLILGAAFDDTLGWLLRGVGAALLLVASLTVLFEQIHRPVRVPAWVMDAYPLVTVALLAGYGLLLGYRPALRSSRAGCGQLARINLLGGLPLASEGYRRTRLSGAEPRRVRGGGCDQHEQVRRRDSVVRGAEEGVATGKHLITKDLFFDPCRLVRQVKEFGG